MYIYRDFNYVEYVLNSEADKGLLLYCRCIDRINNEIIKNNDDRLWQAFINSPSAEGKTFEEFKASMTYKSKNQKLSLVDKKQEESRIIENSKELRKIIEAKDKEYEFKKIAKLNVEGG